MNEGKRVYLKSDEDKKDIKAARNDKETYSDLVSKAKELLTPLQSMVEYKTTFEIAENTKDVMAADPFIGATAYMELLMNAMDILRKLGKVDEYNAIVADLELIIEHPELYMPDSE